MLTAVEQEQASAPKAPPKVTLPHPWAGRAVLYWRETSPGVIAPLPAMLIQPTRATEGWDLNFWRVNQMQGRTNVKFSDTPKAGCWTWLAEDAPDEADSPKRGRGRPRKEVAEEV